VGGIRKFTFSVTCLALFVRRGDPSAAHGFVQVDQGGGIFMICLQRRC
jgi:hypothetical protein